MGRILGCIRILPSTAWSRRRWPYAVFTGTRPRPGLGTGPSTIRDITSPDAGLPGNIGAPATRALTAAGATRSAAIRGRPAAESGTARLEADGNGRWLVDGQPAPRLDGCLDVDLEASALTNALPVRRMDLAVAGAAAAPAAYVRAVGLAVERLEQVYARTTDQGACQRYDYTAPPSTSPPAWSTTNPAWCSTIPGSPPGRAGRSGPPRCPTLRSWRT
jgi:hypothetical protein